AEQHSRPGGATGGRRHGVSRRNPATEHRRSRMSRRGTSVVVAGGGVVGATTALALAETGQRVLLVEPREPKPWRVEDAPDLRVYAVAPASIALLAKLGVWADVLAARAAPYRDMRVWDAAAEGELHFSSADIGAATLGHIVEQN